MRFRIGLLLFPRLTQLDRTGPYEVFIRFPDTDVHLVSKSPEPVIADGGMRRLPSTTFAECPDLDLVCVPGGAGMNPLLYDRAATSNRHAAGTGDERGTRDGTGLASHGRAAREGPG